MAAWHVDFYMVPRRALVASGPLTPSAVDSAEWWAADAFPADYHKRLMLVESAAPSSSADLETWGSADGNRVDVWSHGGRVSRVMVRVDVRRLDSKFGAALLDFVRRAGAVLVRRDGLVVEPIISQYAGALRNSDAWRFANDPAAFFAKHSSDEDDG